MSSPVPCPFCHIASTNPPTSPALPPVLHPHSERTIPFAHVVLSTPVTLAFLDHMPLSPGHLLVIPRTHHAKISDVSEEEARELGLWVSRLSRVLARVTGTGDWNLVQNNGLFLYLVY